MHCLYSGPIVLSIYNPDNDDYLVMYVNFVVILLLFYLLVPYLSADASMDFVELQINEMK
jgi:hypothetical protein